MSQSNRELEEFRRKWKAEVQRRRPESTTTAQADQVTTEESTDAQVPVASSSSTVASSSHAATDSTIPSSSSDDSEPSLPTRELDIATPVPPTHTTPSGHVPVEMPVYFQPVRSMLDSILGEKERERDEARRMFPDKKGKEGNAGVAVSSSATSTPSHPRPPPSSSTRDHTVPKNEAIVPPSRVQTSDRKRDDQDMDSNKSQRERISYPDFLRIMGKADEGMSGAVEGPCPPILRLSDDILLHLMLYTAQMDMVTFMRMAQGCRHLFLLSHHTFLWKSIGMKVFGPWMHGSGRTEEEWLAHYGGDWRRMYIERPRVRFNGIYICVCSYVRTGWDEEAWSQPTHLVTYYRYLRFYTDGRALMLTSTSEPATVVRTLDIHAPGVWQGSWNMDGSDQVMAVFKDPRRPRQSFIITVRLRGTGRGKHDKLRWVSFQSVDDTSESRLDDAHSFSLDHFKTCFFSRVRFIDPGQAA
ncbi:hypothetical protein BJ684DRAFT_22107 [Piptocephalis cylindrospora]|uniref:F-box protein Hrt3/FBXO9 C-terminal domain-containing protein n=1 Tax=Piptocephalis cylindrospora TaxID=1907219 RepID=A0A4V1IXK1_9FUNG|nr:hypothetical protein BJ684DRAFT_22107 [Piptocephalis cylindrospora]|eukprot:RKP11339.1 hypothetical protein BJ684DRAFT_22107 [Piptocephalis cylindrospora]